MRSETYVFVDNPMPPDEQRMMEKSMKVEVLKTMIGTNGYERLEVIYTRDKKGAKLHSFTVRLVDRVTGLVPVCESTGQYILPNDDEACQSLLAIGWPFKRESDFKDYRTGVRRFYQVDKERA